jgi:hypothetical protein
MFDNPIFLLPSRKKNSSKNYNSVASLGRTRGGRHRHRLQSPRLVVPGTPLAAATASSPHRCVPLNGNLESGSAKGQPCITYSHVSVWPGLLATRGIEQAADEEKETATTSFSPPIELPAAFSRSMEDTHECMSPEGNAAKLNVIEFAKEMECPMYDAISYANEPANLPCKHGFMGTALSLRCAVTCQSLEKVPIYRVSCS